MVQDKGGYCAPCITQVYECHFSKFKKLGNKLIFLSRLKILERRCLLLTCVISCSPACLFHAIYLKLEYCKGSDLRALGGGACLLLTACKIGVLSHSSLTNNMFHLFLHLTEPIAWLLQILTRCFLLNRYQIFFQPLESIAGSQCEVVEIC